MAEKTEQLEKDWVAAIGKSAYESIVEMVAALECDYARLEQLRDERDSYEIEDIDANVAPDGPCYANDKEAWAGENEQDADELKELEEAAKPCGNECKSQDDARQMIEEDPLSVQVRSGWVNIGEEFTADEFEILLSTGGPATRIMGELDEHGEPHRAWLEVQDWFKPWTHYFEVDAEVLLTYARCFCFAH